MKNYRPESWSQQAREKADLAFKNYINALSKPEQFSTFDYGLEQREIGTHNPEYWFRTIRDSYRAPIIRQRAAKRFGRKLRNYNKHCTG